MSKNAQAEVSSNTAAVATENESKAVEASKEDVRREPFLSETKAEIKIGDRVFYRRQLSQIVVAFVEAVHPKGFTIRYMYEAMPNIMPQVKGVTRGVKVGQLCEDLEVLETAIKFDVESKKQDA